MKRPTPLPVLFCVVATGLVSIPSGVEAQRARRAPPPVEVQLTADGDSPYRYMFTLTSTGSTEVVADRRLLSFVVRPEGSRRGHRCRHPDAPRSVREGRVRSLPGADGNRVYREWIDLRMYCSGRARAALSPGATVEVKFGFTRRGRNRWAARRSDGSNAVHRIDAPELTVRAAPERPTTGLEGAEAPPIALSMSDVSARTSHFSFRVALRTTEGTKRIYMRDDLLSFVVRGPLGTVTCSVTRQRIVPIVDFYRRVSARTAVRTSIEARRWCPQGTFELAGIYEVAPTVDLIYDDQGYDFDVATGTVVGEPAVVRVSRGERGYVEQVPTDGGPGVM